MPDADTHQLDVQLRQVLDDTPYADALDQLAGYQRGDESLAETLQRLVDAHASFIDRECQACGADLEPLDEHDWLAWRLRVEDTDRRRTDLFCDPGCLADNIGAQFSWGDPTDAIEAEE